MKARQNHISRPRGPAEAIARPYAASAVAARPPSGVQQRASSSNMPRADRLPLPVAIFLAGLIIPWIIPIGPMNLSIYRIALLAMLFPCLLMWVSGKAGPIRTADIALIAYSLWGSLSLAMVHGLEQMIQSIGIHNIETIGAYMLARCYIRTADDFYKMVQFTCWLVVILLPFSLYEWITGAKPLLTIFGLVFPTPDITMMDPRWGLWRVQGPFGHSIVYGVFCGSLVGLAYMVLGYGKSTATRWKHPAIVSLAAFVSMSSAPIAGMIMQFALMFWNTALGRFKWRWKIVWAIVVAAYLVVEFGSNQTPVQFYISHFTFDPQTGWYRLLIWQYGSAAVAANPLFGIGFGEWARPAWMGGSVDNFWLVIAMRHGIPGLVFLGVSCLLVTLGAALKRIPDERADAYRTAYVICMVMFFLVGCTVHFWAATYAWFIFMLGSGVWIMDIATHQAPQAIRQIRSRKGRGSRSEDEMPSL
jgi:O-antigen ligase